MYCTNCGNVINSNSNVCPYCGTNQQLNSDKKVNNNSTMKDYGQNVGKILGKGLGFGVGLGMNIGLGIIDGAIGLASGITDGIIDEVKKAKNR